MHYKKERNSDTFVTFSFWQGHDEIGFTQPLDELANGATKQGVSLSLISGCLFVNLRDLGKM